MGNKNNNEGFRGGGSDLPDCALRPLQKGLLTHPKVMLSYMQKDNGQAHLR